MCISCGASDLVFFIEIVESPESEAIVPLNKSGVFVCKTDCNNTDSGLLWMIQFPGQIIPLPYYLLTGPAARGVVQTTSSNSTTLWISGLPENNNTVVYCTTKWWEASVVATVIVLGKHALNYLSATSIIRCSWDQAKTFR